MKAIAGSVIVLSGVISCSAGMFAPVYAHRDAAFLGGGLLIAVGGITFLAGLIAGGGQSSADRVVVGSSLSKE
jgi:hypothetical protein